MKKILIFLVACVFLQVQGQKKVYIPKEFSTDSALKTWSMERFYQSANFVFSGGGVVGKDPTAYSDKKLSFDPSDINKPIPTF